MALHAKDYSGSIEPVRNAEARPPQLFPYIAPSSLSLYIGQEQPSSKCRPKFCRDFAEIHIEPLIA
jgi:hypothetical protein